MLQDGNKYAEYVAENVINFRLGFFVMPLKAVQLHEHASSSFICNNHQGLQNLSVLVSGLPHKQTLQLCIHYMQ